MEWLQKTKLLFTSVHFTRFRNPAIKLIPLSKIINDRFKIYIKIFARRKIKNISRIFFKLISVQNQLFREKKTIHATPQMDYTDSPMETGVPLTEDHNSGDEEGMQDTMPYSAEKDIMSGTTNKNLFSLGQI